MTLESTLQDRLTRLADDIEVEPAWEAIAHRAEVGSRRRGLAVATPLIMLSVIGMSFAFMHRSGPSRLRAASAPTTASSIAPPRPAVEQNELQPFTHKVTGPVEVLAHGDDAGFAWELFAFPSTYGPCIGVRAADPQKWRPNPLIGFPAGTFRCYRPGSGSWTLAEMSVPTLGPSTDEGAFTTAAPMKAGFVAEGVDRITIKLGEGPERALEEYHPAFDRSLRVAVVPPLKPGTRYTMVSYQQGRHVTTASSTVKSWRPSGGDLGGEIVVALVNQGEKGFTVGSHLGTDVCSGYFTRAGGGGSCGSVKPGEWSGNSETATFPPGVTRVRFTFRDGTVLTTNTFACDVGLPACFAHVVGPEEIPLRVEGFSADGAVVVDQTSAARILNFADATSHN